MANQDIARIIVREGRKRGFDSRVINAALSTALVESGMENVNYGDRDSLGVFQQRPSQGWGTPAQIMDPVYATNAFYDRVSQFDRGQPGWELAADIQRPARQYRDRYRQRWGEAQKYLGSAGGGSGGAELPRGIVEGGGTSSSGVQGAGGGVRPASPTLRRGSRGDIVRDLQTQLKRDGHYTGRIDGIYGPKTAGAVKQYQRSKGLAVDGVVGPNTWGAILSTAPSKPDLPDLPEIGGDKPVALPRTDFKGDGAKKLMVVQDNLGKRFLINTSDESRYPIGGRGALNAALKLTGQSSPITEFNGKPVYLSNWKQGPDIVKLFGGPNQIERVVAGHKKLPEQLGGRLVANPQTVTTGHGETYEAKNKYPDEPVPLPAHILAQFAERRRAATSALEKAKIERQRGRAREESAFEQFRNRLQSQAKQQKRDLAYKGSGRNLAFQPAFMGRGQREIRDQRADRLGEYQSGRTERLSALDQYVQDAKSRREKELAAIDRNKATLRSQPRDYMEALR